MCARRGPTAASKPRTKRRGGTISFSTEETAYLTTVADKLKTATAQEKKNLYGPAFTEIQKMYAARSSVALTTSNLNEIRLAVHGWLSKKVIKDRAKGPKASTARQTARTVFYNDNRAKVQNLAATLPVHPNGGPSRTQKAISMLMAPLSAEARELLTLQAEHINTYGPEQAEKRANPLPFIRKRLAASHTDIAVQKDALAITLYAVIDGDKTHVGILDNTALGSFDGGFLQNHQEQWDSSGAMDIFAEWATVRLGTGDQPDGTVIRQPRAQSSLFALSTNAYGEPIIPKPEEWVVAKKRAKWLNNLVRSILAAYYNLAATGRPGNKLTPWKAIASDVRAFLDEDSIPDFALAFFNREASPYKWTQSQSTELLNFWLAEEAVRDKDTPTINFHHVPESDKQGVITAVPRKERRLMPDITSLPLETPTPEGSAEPEDSPSSPPVHETPIAAPAAKPKPRPRPITVTNPPSSPTGQDTPIAATAAKPKPQPRPLGNRGLPAQSPLKTPVQPNPRRRSASRNIILSDDETMESEDEDLDEMNGRNGGFGYGLQDVIAATRKNPGEDQDEDGWEGIEGSDGEWAANIPPASSSPPSSPSSRGVFSSQWDSEDEENPLYTGRFNGGKGPVAPIFSPSPSPVRRKSPEHEETPRPKRRRAVPSHTAVAPSPLGQQPGGRTTRSRAAGLLAEQEAATPKRKTRSTTQPTPGTARSAVAQLAAYGRK